MSNICCIGAGYVGGSTSCVIADKCPNIQVVVTDISQKQIDKWNSDDLPIYEPGLDAIVKRCRGKNLHFTTEMDNAIKKAEMIFIAVNTPTKNCGLGEGRAFDMSNLEAAARTIARVSVTPKIIVEKSTVPVNAAQTIEKLIRCESQIVRKSAGLMNGDHVDDTDEASTEILTDFIVLSNPEFLAEGSAIRDLTNPDRILIGGDMQSSDGKLAVEALKRIYLHWVPSEKILISSTWSSELSKLASNAFLAQRISGINALSAICERSNADIREVSKAIGMDHRLGPHFLQASLGFGGSCFRKDILNMVYICEALNLPEVASYWYSILQLNDFQTTRFARNIINKLYNTLKNKRIAIFGFTFKANTYDTRDSPTIRVCNQLLQDLPCLAIYDPKASADQIRSDLLLNNNEEIINKHIIVCSSAEEAVRHAHAIVICTEWECFKHLDYSSLHDLMCKPSWIFDGRLILDHKYLTNLGFIVEAVGIDSNNFIIKGHD